MSLLDNTNTLVFRMLFKSWLEKINQPILLANRLSENVQIIIFGI